MLYFGYKDESAGRFGFWILFIGYYLEFGASVLEFLFYRVVFTMVLFGTLADGLIRVANML